MVQAWSSVEKYQLPADWIAENPEIDDSRTIEIPKGLNDWLEASSESLDQLSTEFSSQDIQSLRGLSQEVPWRLAGVFTDLAVTAQGLFGSLGFRGTSTVQLLWTPKKENFRQIENETSQSSSWSGEETDLQEAQVWLKNLHRQGKIKDLNLAKKGLQEVYRQALEWMASSVQLPEGSQWAFQGFQFWLSAEAGGKVSGVGEVSGDLRFRVDVKAIPKTLPREDLSHDSLRKLISTLNQSLESWNPAGEKFEAQSFRVGFARSADGDFGAVNGNFGAAGHLVFAKKPKASTRDFSEMSEPIVVVSRKSKEMVSSENLKKGFRRLEKILGMLTRGLEKNSDGRSWEVSRIKVGLDIGQKGKLGLVSVQNLASAEVTFGRK